MATDSDNETSFGEVMRNMLQVKTGPNTHDTPSIDPEAESDLKLWLQHTGFFDVEYRQKVLGALRKLKAIDEQRWKIISEIQTTSPYIFPPSTPAMPQSPVAFSAYSPSLLPAQKPHQSTLDRLVDYNHLSGLHATASTPSSGGLCGSEPSLVNKGAASDCAYSAFGNGSSSSQQHDVPTRSSSFKHTKQIVDAVTSFVDPDSETHEEQSPQRSKRSIETEANHPDQIWRMDEDAQILTLAPKPGTSKLISNASDHLLTKSIEARYFLVKSFNTMNVEMSQRDGLWITKAKNGPMLTFAFNQCKNVFLIFSVNKSKAFQGYARMTTAPSPDVATANWMGNISWEASDPFRVEWLNTCRTEFWNVGDLKNSFNDEAPVFVGRDGQEYPESCGRKIIEIINRGTGERGGTSPWATRQAHNDTKLASPHSHSKCGKRETLTWRREELPDADEAALFEPVDDMPLIEY